MRFRKAERRADPEADRAGDDEATVAAEPPRGPLEEKCKGEDHVVTVEVRRAAIDSIRRTTRQSGLFDQD